MRWFKKNFYLNFSIIFLSILCLNEALLLRKSFKASKSPLKSKSKFSQNCRNSSFISQIIDHFNFNPSNDRKYKQRYIIFDKYAISNSPIFFYTGNEGDIQLFCENTGFIWEIAPKFDAVVVFAEHRYYGSSLPFGNESFVAPNIDFLTSEQALADYAYLVKHLKSTDQRLKNSPVVAFGGSYGGMLAAWFRMKYPNLINGAIAASAPIWQFSTNCEAFQSVVTFSFKKFDSECPDLIRFSWDIINQYGQSDKGLSELKEIFGLCKPLKSSKQLKDWIADIYGNTAMVNYPYETNFLAPLPAWPVRVMCSNITRYFNKSNPLSVLKSIYHGINVFLNYTGTSSCFDVESDTPSDIGMVAWTYQTCTEFVFPMCTNGIEDMFEKQDWDPLAYNRECYDQFKTMPREEWPLINYGGSSHDIKYHSNLIFSNGNLDPWSAGGVLNDVNEKLKAVIIENGAHHLGKESNEKDPDSVLIARLKEIEAINTWIQDHLKSLLID
ncbi:lysosomal Pro-X carboxypeptidase [Brachionus plicatilis]|uniref:Lysosomal Pro-X carboxypeptidase n=1 Tax=Brachionus plicatilis TaxID=10195 RepID=A0A3M7QTK0_BRAPC|nr:lysosomal Pro-X carboxypeptidase [Brachionus plicatilis]